ncbi:MAG: NAD(P)/FAD-dependent oxidoreductase [Lachnospiraceae bacterium]|nr:NAD(P)/FAD-dependent oxidoreductase [Lachnospiraceae bacterium]
MKKIAVIGGGAAGMMAAISAAQAGKEVHLYEKNEKLGKKLYITGKGRCNLTNASDMDEVMKNVVTNAKFLYSAFYTMSNDDVIQMFEKAGVRTKVERGNRVFPVSDRSSDVISGLTKLLKKHGVYIHLNTEIQDIEIRNVMAEEGEAKPKVKGIFFTDGTKEMFDSVIVATGGCSYPSTGSTGDGYRFAEKTGHKTTKLFPALVPMIVKEEFIRDLQGLSLKNIQVDFYQENKKLYSDFGELLFTHFGVSGPVILSASSILTKRLHKGNTLRLVIDLKPALSETVLDERILKDFQKFKNKNFGNSLNELLPKSIIPLIIMRSGIDEFKKVHAISREERKNLVHVIKNFTLTVTGTRGFQEAIITQGGVEVKELSPASMESKRITGLFFAGEVIDTDALTCGYNLQIAWSTGYLAGFFA